MNSIYAKRISNNASNFLLNIKLHIIQYGI